MTRTHYADPGRLQLADFYIGIADRLAKQYDQTKTPNTKAKLYRESLSFRLAADALKGQNEH